MRQYFKELRNLVLRNIRRFEVKAEFAGNVAEAFAGHEKELEQYLDKLLDVTAVDYDVFSQLGYSAVAAKDLPRNVRARLLASDAENIKNQVTLSGAAITRTTEEQVARVITQYRDDYDLMVKKIESKFAEMGSAAHSRALNIARTETLRIASLGSLRGAVEGGATHKAWIWSGIEREFHASIEADGPVSIEQSFVSGLGNTLDYPGDPSAPAEEVINCGCDMEFLTLTDQESAEIVN